MFAEDLSFFFADYGVDAYLNGASVAVQVIKDEAFLDQLGVSATNPVVLGQAADFALSCVHQTLRIGGDTYTIRDRQPHEDGALVILQLQL